MIFNGDHESVTFSCLTHWEEGVDGGGYSTQRFNGAVVCRRRRQCAGTTLACESWLARSVVLHTSCGAMVCGPFVWCVARMTVFVFISAIFRHGMEVVLL
jgi:hypothetical protein